MKNAVQIFSVPHGLLSRKFSIDIEYEHEELYSLSLTQISTTTFFSEPNTPNHTDKEKSEKFYHQQNYQQHFSKNSTQIKPAEQIKDSFAKNVFIQLGEYFMGQRTFFDIPLKPVGTPFQLRVWEALTKIPYGQTCSYKDVACSVNNPKACRAVGMANNKNPIAIVVPCHRVIGANGKLVGYAGGVFIKSTLLDLEKNVQCSQHASPAILPIF